MLKNTLLSVIVLALVVMVVSSCQKTKDTISRPTNIEVCRNIKEDGIEYLLVPDSLQCYINYVKLKGAAECTQEEAYLCDVGTAIRTDNGSYCKDDHACFVACGVSYGDANRCAKIEEAQNRNLCILGVAIAKKDISLCDISETNETNTQLPITDLKSMCYIEIAKAAKNIKICDRMDSEYKQGCYYVTALSKKEVDACDDAGDRRVECRKKLIFEKAVQNENIDDCFMAGDFDYDVAECITQIAVSKNDESICKRLPDWFGSVQGECHKRVALKEGDISMCEKIDDPLYEGRECYERLSSAETYNRCGSMSQSAAIQCYLNSLCKINGINADCYGTLSSRMSEVTSKALKENKASICEELDNIKPLCYYRFADKLGFYLNDVFKYELFDQDEQLCEKAQGKLREKCFFNLGIEKLDAIYCANAGQYAERCYKNVFLTSKGLTKEQLLTAAQSRVTDENKKIGIASSATSNAGGYFMGAPGVFDVYNDGPEKLDGTNFNLYKDFKLVDIDGCEGNAVVFPKRQTTEDEWDLRHCILEFNSAVEGNILEVTYNGETVLVELTS